jgi:hypothetical protein
MAGAVRFGLNPTEKIWVANFILLFPFLMNPFSTQDRLKKKFPLCRQKPAEIPVKKRQPDKLFYQLIIVS